MFNQILPFLLPLLLLRLAVGSLVLPGRIGFRGFLAHTWLISLRALTFKLRHYLPEATAANGTWGIQIRLKRDQSDKGGYAVEQAFTW